LGNGMVSPERLNAAIRESNADLIGLSELASLQAEAASSLINLYPYQFLNGIGIPGKGLLSRFPLHTAEHLELHPSRPDLQAYATLGTAEETQNLRVIVAHPPPPPTQRRYKQLKSLREMATDGQPTLLMGDFNMVESQPAYQSYVAAGLIDVFREAGTGAGLTYPLRRAKIPLPLLIRIDFIWHTHHLRANRAWVGTDYGSDHLPIFAELTLRT
jgi:vancomycin resistance protein VanJ